MKEESAQLFEQLMRILSNGEWHTIEKIADKLSLTVDSLQDFLISLENAEVIQAEGDQFKKNNLIRGTDFVEHYFELPVEEDS